MVGATLEEYMSTANKSKFGVSAAERQREEEAHRRSREGPNQGATGTPTPRSAEAVVGPGQSEATTPVLVPPAQPLEAGASTSGTKRQRGVLSLLFVLFVVFVWCSIYLCGSFLRLIYDSRAAPVRLPYSKISLPFHTQKNYLL
jgi:hypothetical protein